MHLLVNGRFLTKPLAGVDRTAQEMVRALCSLASERDLVIDCAVPRGAPDDEEIRERLHLPSTSRLLRSRLSGYLFEQLALPRALPEAILLNLCNMGPVARRRQAVMIHDAQVFDAPASYGVGFRLTYRALQPRLARRADRVLTVSDYSRARLAAHGVSAGRTVDVIHNGADHLASVTPDGSLVERRGLRGGGYAFALAHPAAHKNLRLLFAAYAAQAHELPPLVLAGASAPDSIPADPRIVHLGRVSDGELKALYHHARMFIFPSLTEGFGFPALEAMACGCPVIAARAGALPEVVGDAAILVDPHDCLALAQAIADLQACDDRRNTLAQAGLERAARFTWRAAATRLIDVLGNVDKFPRSRS